jgi:hypothetical protein
MTLCKKLRETIKNYYIKQTKSHFGTIQIISYIALKPKGKLTISSEIVSLTYFTCDEGWIKFCFALFFFGFCSQY